VGFEYSVMIVAFLVDDILYEFCHANNFHLFLFSHICIHIFKCCIISLCFRVPPCTPVIHINMYLVPSVFILKQHPCCILMVIEIRRFRRACEIDGAITVH
jgi:hypothetical protein